FFEWGGRGKRLNATKYVELLKASYYAVKAADPNAVVVSGGLTPTGWNDGDTAYDDLVYMDMMYQAGVKDYCDAIGVHGTVVMPYAANLAAGANGDHGSFYFRRFEQIRDIMVKYGDQDKQMWFTEFGWPSSTESLANFPYATKISEAQQSEWLVQAYQLAKVRGYVGVMLLWNLNFAPTAEANDVLAKAAYSVLHRDWSPRPGYNALAAMAK
ncbi:MAG: hypothetical protein Q7O66_16930, partial [Dehalococcoidia bacterium]|nr:hypothetical protein [Dehalococcoidia bacterium]